MLIVVVVLFAYYYSTSSSSSASLESQVSSLSSASVSLGDALASAGAATTSSGSIVTHTVISTATTTSAETITEGPAATVTVTTTKPVTQTITQTVGGADIVSLTGALQLGSGGNGTGTLTVSLMNQGYDPIDSIGAVIPTGSNPQVDLCTNNCTIQLLYNAAQVSPSSQLSGGQTATGSAQTSEGTPGATYTISVTVSFADGSQQVQNLQVTAQTS